MAPGKKAVSHDAGGGTKVDARPRWMSLLDVLSDSIVGGRMSVNLN